MLEEVYKSSTQGFEGSAQNELNTYLDSIEARTTKFKEAWAQIWQSDAMTNGMKGTLDIGTGILKALGTFGPKNILGSLLGIGGAKAFNFGGMNLNSCSY